LQEKQHSLLKKTKAPKAVLVKKKTFLSRNSSFRHGAIIFNGSIYLFFSIF
jgi:hypothetical protein